MVEYGVAILEVTHVERLLDRLTHHAHVLTCNGDSYRLADAKRRRAKQDKPAPKTANEP